MRIEISDKSRWFWPAVCALLALIPSVAHGRAMGDTDSIRIGSKNFPESHLLGEIMALLIEEHCDVEVEHKSGLGGTLVCFEALRAGGIDIYPEYTGTAWAAILKEESKVTDPMRAFLHVEREFRRRYDIEWLEPFGPNNTYALALRADRARELGVRTISDLVPIADSLTAGFSFEFVERDDGYAGLAPYYGLDFAEVKGMEHALAYAAIAEGSIDVLDAYSTDGKLLRYELAVLEDDRNFFPPYHVAPLLRGETARRLPAIAECLSLLAFRLDDQQMTALNHRVEIEGQGFTQVARDWLVSEGLLQSADGQARADATERGDLGFWAFFIKRTDVTTRLIAQHLRMTLLSVLLACLIALPLGIGLSNTTWAGNLALGAAGVVQTIPSLALLAFLIAMPGLGLSMRSAVVALTLYALLPILRNTITGIRETDPLLLDAARGIGLTDRQCLLRVRLPLATRTIMAGIRTATVITVGFATLAAFIGAGGLGEPILTGLYLNDTRLILAGALPAACLALIVDASLGCLERLVVPRGLREE